MCNHQSKPTNPTNPNNPTISQTTSKPPANQTNRFAAPKQKSGTNRLAGTRKNLRQM
jgi:hypothetical protein